MDTTTPTTYEALQAARAASSEARIRAAASGLTHYNGTPCKKCSNVLRYTRSSMCVMCTRLKQNNARKRWAEMIEAATTPVGG